jgi:mRNA interferase RelE/StbE
VTYTIEWARRTQKQLEKLERTVQKRVVLAVLRLAEDPRPHGARCLVGRPGEYRVRVGDYRVVYEIQDDRLVILVVTAAHRREVYRDSG